MKSSLRLRRKKRGTLFMRLRQTAGLTVMLLGLGCALCALLWVTPALAQEINIKLGDDPSASGTLTGKALQIIALITVLSLAPSILVMVTSFTRIVVVFAILRTGLGLQQSPPNSVMISLALFLTAFIMAPVFEKSYKDGIEPLMNETIEMKDAFGKTTAPFKTFMLKHVRDKDLKLFMKFSGDSAVQNRDDISLRVLTPAFMISELRRAFEIGFLLFLPFIVIDLVVASVLMSMGMMMLPPVMISLPFKLIFFVLVDGWHLVAGSLIQSFGG